MRTQKDVLSRSQALERMTWAAIRYRLRPGGTWRVVLPGVYLTNGGLPTVSQREMAALLYCGAGSAITGPAALARQGVRTQPSEIIDVLVPEPRKRQSVSFVRVHRTIHMPERVLVSDGLRYAPVARSVADTARELAGLREVRAVVADAVQRGRCSVRELAVELTTGTTKGSAGLRVALAEVADGVRSVAEAELRALIKSAGLPTPFYNPFLYVGHDFLARPDVWWPDAGVACEVDSREWHLSPDGWERTVARSARMSAHGIVVLHVTPGCIRAQGSAVISELRQAVASGLKRPRLPIRTLPGAEQA
jgi:hypothetical protein